MTSWAVLRAPVGALGPLLWPLWPVLAALGALRDAKSAQEKVAKVSSSAKYNLQADHYSLLLQRRFS